ncbi:MAG: hypothetical protein ACXQT4_07115 [Methanotrichaceae archaeon]
MSKKNRPTRDIFQCVKCEFAGPADHIAAINIAARADASLPKGESISLRSREDVNRPIVSEHS